MYTLSASTLNLMQECERCFYLSLVKGIKRPSGPMSSIPIKMDSILKKYFEKYRAKDEVPPIIKEQLKVKLPKNMPKTLYAELDGIKIKGLPDEYVELSDGSIVPFDHKTKSKAPEETHQAYQNQLNIYTFLLKSNNYKTTNKGFLAYYYPDDCDVHNGLDLHCKIVEVKTNPEKVKELILKAKKVLEGNIPKAAEECEWCKYREK